MGLLLLPATLLLVASGGQDSAKLVDGMIERSNALKSFVATYTVHGRSKEGAHEEYEGSMRLVYRAPESLVVEVATGAIHGRSVIAGGRMAVYVEKDGRSQRGVAEESTASAEANERIGRVFHEQLAALGRVEAPTGLGVFVRFRFKAGTDSERPEFQIEAGTGRGDGALLGWLESMKRSEAKPSSDGKSVVWDAVPGIRVTLQEATGFIDTVVSTYQGETKTVLELEDLVLDPKIEDAEFRSPEADPKAEDISEGISRTMAIMPLIAMRGAIHNKIRAAVESGALEWTAEDRARLGKVFRALHAELAPLLAAETLLSARTSVDKFSAWYQEAKRAVPESDHARADAVEEALVQYDTRIRDNLERAVEPYLARAVPDI